VYNLIMQRDDSRDMLMSQDEICRLEQAAARKGKEQEIVVQLMRQCGLRTPEIRHL
jgi:hypothetical protein